MTFYESGAALAAAKRDIAVRLRRVCDHCSETEFDQLVLRIARIEVKYRSRDMLDFLLPSRSFEAVDSADSLASRSKGMNSAA